MLAAPASIAAPPSPKSVASWSPAVPPPPAPGGPVTLGVGLAAELGVGVRVGVFVAAAPGGDEDEELELALPEPLAPGPLAAAWLVEPLEVADPLEVAEPVEVAVGGGTLPDAEVGDDVQPATAAEATMAKTPKRMTVSFALSTEPAITRTVM
jgi:hypothetical protein